MFLGVVNPAFGSGFANHTGSKGGYLSQILRRTESAHFSGRGSYSIVNTQRSAYKLLLRQELKTGQN